MALSVSRTVRSVSLDGDTTMRFRSSMAAGALALMPVFAIAGQMPAAPEKPAARGPEIKP
ncbi:hypothetical protein [Burkholderia stabilis]|uniref:hypothetical protein n=1 Tax=Burkholderia stabilis TaxID=95485 RepID=UPI0009F4311E|nr:hypothetical protein [Burkholderia stabilis]HDR9494190.1 hypothetical protein [Burkholderia stabilis]HDR9527729.1 hypothetical protein [Burkholderia stabilis]HDR9531775.1 hypothetical protein [Burkholderia stabilis]HDR9541158.1 hypothetical protein [Burkholderia stabilis]HDR9543253.1 hypothetical protein [Burkholderia stabilis]